MNRDVSVRAFFAFQAAAVRIADTTNTKQQ